MTGARALCGFPRCQCGLGGGWIILDAIDRLAAQVGGLRDRDDVGALAKHVLHRGELVAAIAWLPPAVALAAGLGVFTPEPEPSESSTVRAGPCQCRRRASAARSDGYKKPHPMVRGWG